MPILISQSTGSLISPQFVEIMSFVPLSIGAIHAIGLPDKQTNLAKLIPLQELPIASLPHSGLNGRSFWRYKAEFIQ